MLRFSAMRAAISAIAVAISSALVCAAGQPVRTPPLGFTGSAIDLVLARVALRVQEYFARAQSIVCQETVRIQPLDFNSSAGAQFGRHLLYELRVAWDPAVDDKPPEATVQRQLLKVNGRAPKPNDTDTCFDPKPVSPEPLAMFLAHNQLDFVFTSAGTRRLNGRESLTLDYKPRDAPGKPAITWHGSCVSVELPHWSHGRVWVDAANGDVLRLDESINRRFEFSVPREQQVPFGPTFMVIERADSSIRYKAVAFHDPDETVLLPESIETMQVFQNRTRISQTFSEYRRFMTGGRLVKD